MIGACDFAVFVVGTIRQQLLTKTVCRIATFDSSNVRTATFDSGLRRRGGGSAHCGKRRILTALTLK